MIIRDNDFALEVPWEGTAIRRYVFAAVSLFAILIITYGNSFDCSWHFDDYINIVENFTIHIGALSWVEIEKGLYGVLNLNRWQRPISYFSFAVNFYFNGLDVFGYHVVNFLIHYIASVFLFLFLYNTLRLPILEGRYEKRAYSIALLSALFWAINPVQVMAVTYIVQRMAGMTAMFYIMAMYFYLKGRIGDSTWKNIIFFVLAAICAVLSIGSKENAVMLPVSLLLYDLFLIQGLTYEHIKRSSIPGLLALLFVPAMGLLMYSDVSSIVGDYVFRPFTMTERMLTQPRVFLFYISLLLYPISSRLMLIHDMAISKSLFDPWTTIVSIILLLLIIVFVVLIARKRPLISYCIIFFFLNHLIEGSFISLELVYEHRNYLPSMLFFVPLSILIVYGLDYFRGQKRMLYLLASSVTAIMIILGVTVFIQNNILKDDISLWSDNAEKVTNINVVHNNLAAAMLSAGRLPEAYVELNRALESSAALDFTAKFKTRELLGKYYLYVGDDEKALMNIEEALKGLSSSADLYISKAVIMLRKKLPRQAEECIKKAIYLAPERPSFHINLGKILLFRGYPDDAIREAQKELLLGGDYKQAYLLISDAYSAKKNKLIAGHFKSAAMSSKGIDKRCP